MMWADDPLRDFDRWSEAQEKTMCRYPVCAGCGDRITEGDVHIVYWKHKPHLFCDGCVETASLRDYIADDESAQWGIA